VSTLAKLNAEKGPLQRLYDGKPENLPPEFSQPFAYYQERAKAPDAAPLTSAEKETVTSQMQALCAVTTAKGTATVPGKVIAGIIPGMLSSAGIIPTQMKR
jgi:hypothetical protein